MISNEYVGIYYYSAIFQGNMALLALLGVFVVFKRQELSSELHAKYEAIVRFVQNYLDLVVQIPKHVAINYPSVQALPDILLNMSKDTTINDGVRARAGVLYNDSNFNARYDECKALLDKRATVSKLLKVPLIWILSVIIASLILIPLAHQIHTKTPTLEIVLIALSALANIWALIETTRYVLGVLKEE